MPISPERSLPLGLLPAMDRRSFLRGLSLAGLGLACGGTSFARKRIAAAGRRYCVVGSAERLVLYRKALRDPPTGEIADLVNTTDVGHGAARYLERRWAERRVDTVIAAAPWDVSAAFILSAFRAGCDVFVETNGAVGTKTLDEILKAWRGSGRSFRLLNPEVALPANLRVKALLADGRIGELLSIDFNAWPGATETNSSKLRAIDGSAADRLRHFDVLNGWIGAKPVRLNARATAKSSFPDTVCVTYDNGVIATYSRHASPSSPIGTYRVAFNGTRGRIEHSVSAGAPGDGGQIRADDASTEVTVSETRVSPWFGTPGARERVETPLAFQHARMIAALVATEIAQAKSSAIHDADRVAATLKSTIAAQQIGRGKPELEIEV